MYRYEIESLFEIKSPNKIKILSIHEIKPWITYATKSHISIWNF